MLGYLTRNAKVIGISLLLVALVLFMCVFGRENFVKPNNIENLMERTAMYGILAIGVAFVIISSGIDLSIGSMVCLSACLLAIFLEVRYEPRVSEPVLAIKAKDKQVVLRAGVDKFAEGDWLHYTEGINARDELMQVQAVTQESLETTSGSAVETTVLTVDREFTRDDRTGRIVLAFALSAVGESGKSVTLKSNDLVGTISPRDKVAFMKMRQSGDNWILGNDTQVIDEIADASGALQLTLRRAPSSNVDETWVAVPRQRLQRMPILAAVLSVIGIGLLLGCIHGLLVTKVELPPFVVTLCGLLIYRGLSRWLTEDQVVGFNDEYDATLRPWVLNKLELMRWTDEMGREVTFGIPYPFFVLLIVMVVATIVLNRSVWGRYLQALGRNENAAKYSGIKTDRVTIGAYVACTGIATLGGIVFAIKYNSVSPSSFGNFYELYAIAAAVLGSCSLRGGEGSIIGVVIGTAVMQVLNNMTTLLGISNVLEYAIIGSVILVGVIADVVFKKAVDYFRAKASRA